MSKRVALIVGAGPGISAAFGESLVADGYQVALAARDMGKLRPLAAGMGATPFQADASAADSLVKLFEDVDRALGEPEVVLFNPSARIRGDLLSLDIEAASAAIQTVAIGALVTAQEAARRMLPRGTGSIFFTGATAGIKGFARSSVFAMGKFAVRGLAQSLARELGPAGIHPISPRETPAFRPARDSDARSTACLPRLAFLHVCRGVMAWVFGILYGCPVLDAALFGSCACG
jgi:NAD(P)-dependent dehydrogenase (short-subunit alcohol dehydrogenase family)